FADAGVLRKVSEQREFRQARAVLEAGFGFFFAFTDRIQEIREYIPGTGEGFGGLLHLLKGLEREDVHFAAVSAGIDNSLFRYIQSSAIGGIDNVLLIGILLEHLVKERRQVA